MINYLNLPDDMRKFLKEFDHTNLIKNIPDHAWTYLPIDLVITQEGKQWFIDKKITLARYALVFKLPKNCEGAIHADMLKFEKPDCAFNFVLSGHGEMQWVTNLEATEHSHSHGSTNYIRYTNVVKFDILDIWTGNNGLVRVNAPHRIVTTDTDRYCLSLRLEKDSPLNTFDSLCELLRVD